MGIIPASRYPRISKGSAVVRGEPMERPPSLQSDICRICHCEGEGDLPLISPCQCAGSLRYVHQVCLQQWINSSDTRRCELCKFEFLMQTRVKPFRKWEKLDMSPIERRKMFCSITFHVIAITCVIWSLYVLIDRTAEELRSGALDWPFWTKLVVVAIGFTGGLVFMYVQCKVYVQLFRRWRAYNRIIFVQSVPKKQQPPTLAVAPASEPPPPQQQQQLQRGFQTTEEFHSCESGGGESMPSPPPIPPQRPSHFTVDIETQTEDHAELT